jgi:hypothetical protein
MKYEESLEELESMLTRYAGGSDRLYENIFYDVAEAARVIIEGSTDLRLTRELAAIIENQRENCKFSTLWSHSWLDVYFQLDILWKNGKLTINIAAWTNDWRDNEAANYEIVDGRLEI